MTKSEISDAQFTFTQSSAVAPPQFTPDGGAYPTYQNVTISSSTAGATVRYTLDGSTPTTTHGFIYGAPIFVPSTVTIKALAYKNGTTSDVVSRTFNISVPIATAASPVFGGFSGTTSTSPVTITLTTATQDAVVIFTTDGSDPTKMNGVFYFYLAPVQISQTTTIRVVAVKSGMAVSSVVSKTITINVPASTVVAPAASPHGGVFLTDHSLSVSLTTTTSGADIRYTTDGVSNPTSTTGTLYDGNPIAVSANTEIRAIAYKSGMTDSAVLTERYFLAPPVSEDPEFSITPGSYLGTQSVSLSTGTVDAAIYYTLNGDVPSAASTLYSGPITVTDTTTIKAIAITPDIDDSDVVEGTFTIIKIISPVDDPRFSPDGGGVATSQSITLSSGTSGATIRYTTDGSTPSESTGTIYSVPFTLSEATTIKAIAYKSGSDSSPVVSRTFTIAATGGSGGVIVVVE